jgi:hypothetical protein
MIKDNLDLFVALTVGPLVLFFVILFTLLLLRSLLIALKVNWKPMIKFSCWIGWHWSSETVGWNGCSFKGVCKGCKKEGLFDSNGDFFTTKL